MKRSREKPAPSPTGGENRETVSVCIITYNEAGNIAACLDSVSWADEIIVVDSHSTDDTVQIARRHTDRVIVRDWPGHVAQKNFAAEQARCDWILALDADERVSSRLGDDIQAVLRQADPARIGFRFPRRNYYLGRWWRRGGWYPDLKLRFWRRGHGRWGGEDPHDHVVLEGPVGHLSSELFHFTYRDISDHLRKLNSYSSIAARARLNHGGRFRYQDLLFRPPWRFLRMFVLKGGWREGVAGLILSANEAFYVFQKYSKMWEIQKLGAARQRESSLPPGSFSGDSPSPPGTPDRPAGTT